jgi:FkbM family methyltransferase
LYGEWAELEIGFLCQFLRVGDTVLDVGAFIGTHTLAFAHAVGRSGRVLAFEPHPVAHRLLSLNIAENSLENVELCAFAVSDGRYRYVNAYGNDTTQTRNFGANTAIFDRAIADEEATAQAGAATISFSRTIDDLGLHSCRLLKIDVEGHGAAVLRGAYETLRSLKPIVFTEINSVEEGSACLEVMRPLGFDAWAGIFDAFNPDNYKRCAENILPGREVSLIFAPREILDDPRKIKGPPGIDLVHVRDRDDIVLAMLAKPQYKGEVLATRREHTFQDLRFFANSTELAEVYDALRAPPEVIAARQRKAAESEAARQAAEVGLRAEVERLQGELAARQAECVERAGALARLRAELLTSEEYLRELAGEKGRLAAEGEQLRRQLRRIKRGFSWRFTRPLRRLVGATGHIWRGAVRLVWLPVFGFVLERAGKSKKLGKLLPARHRRLAATMRLVRRSGVFDHQWYSRRYPEAAAKVNDPILHYCRYGWKKGLDPNPLFDSDWYLSRNTDVPRGINPLAHYLEFGATEGRNPNPLFDGAWYLVQNPHVADSEVNPLAHYLRRGAAEGRDPNPLFDGAWYLAENPDVADAGINPLAHYLGCGAAEGRDPNPLFDSDWYLAQNPDVAKAGINPLAHYLECWAAEGRDPNPLFDSAWYLGQNPDVAEAGINPLLHYLRVGQAEGRLTSPLFLEHRVRCNVEELVTAIEVEDAIPQKGLRRMMGSRLAARVADKRLSLDAFIVDHAMGGGANAYRNRLAEDQLRAGATLAILTYNLWNKSYQVEISSGEEHIQCSFSETSQLKYLCRAVIAEEVIINNVVSYVDPPTFLSCVLELQRMWGAKLTVAFHDYFAVCPSFTLLNDRSEFCGVPDVAECVRCIQHNPLFLPEQLKTRDIVGWRSAWRKVLDVAERVVFFSRASYELALRAYPQLRAEQCVISPHVVDYMPTRDFSLNLAGRLHIGVVGEISFHKGAKVVADLFAEIEASEADIGLTVIGTMDTKYAPEVPRTGRYRPEDLAGVLRETGINVCLVPSIWPETFCYVAEELMALRMPLAVFDLGAPAERARDYPLGLVLPIGSPAAVLAALQRFRERLAERGDVNPPTPLPVRALS